MLDYEVFEFDYEDAQTLVEFASPEDFIGWGDGSDECDFAESYEIWGR